MIPDILATIADSFIHDDLKHCCFGTFHAVRGQISSVEGKRESK
jgi:hypothetical protein